jgi:hypothetical protein
MWLIDIEQGQNSIKKEYLNFGSGIDAIRPENNGYSASIWLGDSDCCDGKTLSEKYQGNNGCR